MTIPLYKEKIGLSVKAAKIFVEQMTVCGNQIGDDFAKSLFTFQLEAFILHAGNQKQAITIYRPPQKFWDWLFRRPQSFVIEINCREVLHNPTQLQESTLLYNLNEQTQ